MDSNSVPMKTYKLYYTLARLNVTFHLSSSTSAEPASYYGETCWGGFVTNKPQVILRQGGTKTSPIIAAAKLHTTSRDIQLCLGNYEKEHEKKVVWEDMRRDKNRMMRGDYMFSTASGSVDGVPRTYNWKRDAEKVGSTVYNCVNDQGKVVARVASGGFFNWKKAGEIDIVEGLEEAMETLLLVSAGSLIFAEAGWSVWRGYEKGSTKEQKGVKSNGKTV